VKFTIGKQFQEKNESKLKEEITLAEFIHVS
jgi:hypothetical protein